MSYTISNVYTISNKYSISMPIFWILPFYRRFICCLTENHFAFCFFDIFDSLSFVRFQTVNSIPFLFVPVFRIQSDFFELPLFCVLFHFLTLFTTFLFSIVFSYFVLFPIECFSFLWIFQNFLKFSFSIFFWKSIQYFSDFCYSILE